MYGRDYNGKTYTLEASGGLINGSLVMQDKETDSYWFIMSDEVIAGELAGTKINEMPVGKKMRWKDWVKKHPNTLVLSVKGKEDVAFNRYENYFASTEGFRGLKAKDTRVHTKQPIYSFHLEGEAYAVPYFLTEDGRSFELRNDLYVFFYRPKDVDLLHSTVAYISNTGDFQKQNSSWIHSESKCQFDSETGLFNGEGDNCPSKLNGFDTFWYNWSLNNPGTKILAE